MKILISGASGGIGREISAQLAKEGHELILLCNNNTSVFQEFVDNQSPKAKVLSADLSDEKSWEDLNFENVDALINLIGISSSGASWKIPIQEWNSVFKINTEIPFRLAQKVIPSMRSKGFGRIIFFSSIVAQKGIFVNSAYSASKSALHGLTRTMASELIQKGITVNCIAPGYINTGMIHELQDTFQQEIIERIPSKEFGDVQNIVNVIKFLLDKKSDYITGQILSVNGGFE